MESRFDRTLTTAAPGALRFRHFRRQMQRARAKSHNQFGRYNRMEKLRRSRGAGSARGTSSRQICASQSRSSRKVFDTLKTDMHVPGNQEMKKRFPHSKHGMFSKVSNLRKRITGAVSHTYSIVWVTNCHNADPVIGIILHPFGTARNFAYTALQNTLNKAISVLLRSENSSLDHDSAIDSHDTKELNCQVNRLKVLTD